VPIEQFEESNLIVNGARIQMAHLIAGDVDGRSIGYISVGTNGDDPVVDDTEITDDFTKEVDGFEYPANGQVQVNWKLLASEANGKAIREFGLLTEDGTLFARRIRTRSIYDELGNLLYRESVPIYKESDISIEGEWIIIF
jgi:hypothetical protein